MNSKMIHSTLRVSVVVVCLSIANSACGSFIIDLTLGSSHSTPGGEEGTSCGGGAHPGGEDETSCGGSDHPGGEDKTSCGGGGHTPSGGGDTTEKGGHTSPDGGHETADGWIELSNAGKHVGVTSFTGRAGGHGGFPVQIETNVPVETKSGGSPIFPMADAINTITFTPDNGNLFMGFSFRGHLERGALGTVTVQVVGNRGSQQTFEFGGLGEKRNFQRVGIVSPDGETIRSVTLISAFSQQKQNQFCLVPVPEPSSFFAAFLVLFPLGIGVIKQWRTNRTG